jgi:hypothetical protein
MFDFFQGRLKFAIDRQRAGSVIEVTRYLFLRKQLAQVLFAFGTGKATGRNAHSCPALKTGDFDHTRVN